MSVARIEITASPDELAEAAKTGIAKAAETVHGIGAPGSRREPHENDR